MPLRPLTLLLAALLVAGCADDHAHGDGGHHGAGGGAAAEGPILIVGVDNKGAHALSVEIVLTHPNGTTVWTERFDVPAGYHPEKTHPLDGTGLFTLDVSYSWTVDGRTADASDRAVLDTAECGGIHHLTFTVKGSDAIEKEDLHRECHEE